MSLTMFCYCKFLRLTKIESSDFALHSVLMSVWSESLLVESNELSAGSCPCWESLSCVSSLIFRADRILDDLSFFLLHVAWILFFQGTVNPIQVRPSRFGARKFSLFNPGFTAYPTIFQFPNVNLDSSLF